MTFRILSFIGNSLQPVLVMETPRIEVATTREVCPRKAWCLWGVLARIFPMLLENSRAFRPKWFLFRPHTPENVHYVLRNAVVVRLDCSESFSKNPVVFARRNPFR